MGSETTPRDTSAIVDRLRAAGCVFAEEEAALLIAEAPGTEVLESMVQQRVSGIPLEYIVGWADFCGIRMTVEPGVFVPRHRSEFLVERASVLTNRGSAVLDLCCGAGAIGAVVAARSPGIELYAADIDPIAVRCARRNIGAAGRVFEGDLFDALPADLGERIDLIVVNAPYVPTAEIAHMPPEAREHERLATLDGGDDGLDVHRRIAASVRGWLKPGGHLLIETSEAQAELSAAIFERGGLTAQVEHSEELDATIVRGSRAAGA